MPCPQLHPVTDRVRRLVDIALSHHVHRPWEAELYSGESLMASQDDPFWVRRRAKAVEHILRNATVEIGGEELLVGRPSLKEPTGEEAERLEKARIFLSAQPRAAGQSGHCCIDLPKLLSLGAAGVRDEVRALRAARDAANPADTAAIAFYDACEEALDGLCEYARRHAEEAQRLAEHADPERREELLQIADRCRRVPEHPARTFAEALQAVSMVNGVLHWAQGTGLVSPGHLDRWALPYYEADIADGTLTPGQAQELLDCFYIMPNENVQRGLAIGLMVGGRGPDGEDVTNDLSYMCLQSIRNVGLAYPGVGICYHGGTPDDLLELGCAVLSEVGANPAVFNDGVITRGLLNAGVTPTEACEYQNSTCVEITPAGASNVWVASPYFNLCQILLDLLGEIASGTTAAGDLESLFTMYTERLGVAIHDAVARNNANRHSCYANRTFPLISCFMRDCLERGLDIDQGGARYNWIECSFVGLANFVDSLAVIREYVYGDRARELPGESIGERIGGLLDILGSDFAEREDLRREFINRVPSYGNDEPCVDELAVRITDFIAKECSKHDVMLGGGFKPGFFCWVMHERLGSQTGATPDGRRAGTPFADGAGPAQGRERKGPTAAVKSITCWDHTPMLGGLVLNLKFSKEALASEESRAKLADLIRTYMRLGGFEVQVNVVDRQTLVAAQADPERYRDLVVRVAGYTDYFTGLSRAMQDEIIARTEFEAV